MIKNPVFNHYGVFVRYNGQDLVIHKNSTNVERITTLDEFLKGYELRGAKRTPYNGKSATELILRFEEMTDREFNLFYDNCEEFAHELTKTPYNGRELDKGVFLVVLIAVAALLYSE